VVDNFSWEFSRDYCVVGCADDTAIWITENFIRLCQR
jgi:hypothetical protein